MKREKAKILRKKKMKKAEGKERKNNELEYIETTKIFRKKKSERHPKKKKNIYQT